MNYKKITVNTLAKIAIGLFVIIGLGVLVGTFQNNTFDNITELGKQITAAKADVVDQEEFIAEREEKIAEQEEKLPGLKEAKTTAQKNLNKAEAALDIECSRSEYYWRYCDNTCKPLHSAVDTASYKFDSAKQNVENCEKAIVDCKVDIENAHKQIDKLNGKIKDLSAQKASATWSAIFLVIAMLLALTGIVFLSRFLLDRTNKKIGLIACGLLAGSSFLYMVLPTATTFLTYLLGMIVFALFAALIKGDVKHRIATRVFVIILSVIIHFATLIFAPITALCSAIAFILVSLVLVPCVFTEYLDIAKHIFFTIITFGIWHLIWMYNHTENLNKVEQAEKRAPIRELLLCAFLPLYYIFWTYKTAGNTELYANEKGKNFKIDILCFILSVVNPLLASVIIQDKINIIVGKPVVENVIEEVSEEAPVEEILEEASIAE